MTVVSTQGVLFHFVKKIEKEEHTKAATIHISRILPLSQFHFRRLLEKLNSLDTK